MSAKDSSLGSVDSPEYFPTPASTPKLEATTVENAGVVSVLTSKVEKSLSRRTSLANLSTSPQIMSSYQDNHASGNSQGIGRPLNSIFSSQPPSARLESTIYGPTPLVSGGSVYNHNQQARASFEGYPQVNNPATTPLQPSMQPPRAPYHTAYNNVRHPAPAHLPPGFNDVLARNRPVLETNIVPGSARIPECQVSVAYGYGIYRSNGTFTRLVPADELPALTGVPKLQGPEGLIILPTPLAPSPHDREQYPYIPNTMVPVEVVNQIFSENIRPRDSYSRNPYGRYGGAATTDVQGAIDNIVRSSAPVPKTHCTKWIHEGVCAFVQQGCKFKHEMPEDEAGLAAVGLNVVPKWYRLKQQQAAAAANRRAPSVSEQSQTPRGIPTGPPRQQRDMSGSWRGIGIFMDGGGHNSGRTSDSMAQFHASKYGPPPTYGLSGHGPIESRPVQQGSSAPYNQMRQSTSGINAASELCNRHRRYFG